MMQIPEPNQQLILGQTRIKNDITLSRFGSGKLAVLLIAGVHGNESEGFLLSESLEENLKNSTFKIDKNISLFFCHRINPDGCARQRRTNQNNVDLNRNLPTKDWQSDFDNVKYYPGASPGSEIESRLTIELIETISPSCIISLHSYENAMINFNGPCEDWAIAMSKFNQLPPKGDIGYPTPGSLGTWAGWERNIPVITLEILRGQSQNDVWDQHARGLVHAIEYYHHNPKAIN